MQSAHDQQRTFPVQKRRQKFSYAKRPTVASVCPGAVLERGDRHPLRGAARETIEASHKVKEGTHPCGQAPTDFTEDLSIDNMTTRGRPGRPARTSSRRLDQTARPWTAAPGHPSMSCAPRLRRVSGNLAGPRPRAPFVSARCSCGLSLRGRRLSATNVSRAA
jgi:hypothetical protein